MRRYLGQRTPPAAAAAGRNRLSSAEAAGNIFLRLLHSRETSVGAGWIIELFLLVFSSSSPAFPVRFIPHFHGISPFPYAAAHPAVSKEKGRVLAGRRSTSVRIAPTMICLPTSDAAASGRNIIPLRVSFRPQIRGSPAPKKHKLRCAVTYVLRGRATDGSKRRIRKKSARRAHTHTKKTLSAIDSELPGRQDEMKMYEEAQVFAGAADTCVDS